MKTPISDFIDEYNKQANIRLHMPGHKGHGLMPGLDELDITEIDGADELYEASGIIAESERNAGALFGAETFYSAEGSSLSIRAMLYLVTLWAKRQGRRPHILAARNVHKTYINTAALLDIETTWIMGRKCDSYEVCRIEAAELARYLDDMEELPVAVYITSPDYLGHIADVEGMARCCHERGVLLLVDNAHGAYLRFMDKPMHPIELGADMCADSAHKTLPVLTGGAYLHISGDLDAFFRDNARVAMQVFGSTSPSYLILRSLDLANPYLETLRDRLEVFVRKVEQVTAELKGAGYRLLGEEPLKLTIDAGAYGYSGDQLAGLLMEKGIYSEYHDAGHLVLMVTPETGDEELKRLVEVMTAIPKREPGAGAGYEGAEAGPDGACTAATEGCQAGDGLECQDRIPRPEQVMSPREAMLAEAEDLPAEECIGRVLAAAAVSCPPAVPILMMGERIDRLVAPGRKLKVVKEAKGC